MKKLILIGGVLAGGKSTFSHIVGERFGISVSFGEGSILYKETISEAVHGAGHFEPALDVQGLPESADGAGVHRADPAQEANVAVAALQAFAQREGRSGMNAGLTYTVKLIQ